MKKHSDSGFSLVELIIAFAIFAIAGITIAGFVSFGSKNYGNANKNVKLQYEQQIVVNRVRDEVMETTRAIAFDKISTSLIMFGGTDKDHIVVKKIYYSAPEEGKKTGTLKYAVSSEYKVEELDGVGISSITFSTPNNLTDTMMVNSDSEKSFDADLSRADKGSVLLTLGFMVGEKKLVVNPEVALRNTVAVLGDGTDDEILFSAEELDEIYSSDEVDMPSTGVAKIDIYKDGKYLNRTTTDSINLVDESSSVTAMYTADVVKKEYFTGEFNTDVTWKLTGAPSGVTYSSTGHAISITVSGSVESGTTFILTAVSEQDPTKSASIRIKIGTGGVYPVSIVSSVKKSSDVENAVAIYTFVPTITYTGYVKDSSGNDVTSLTGTDAYKRINPYEAFDEDGIKLNIPGAGFSTSDSIDGRFLAVKSMEGKTYKIRVQVTAMDKNGNPVYEEQLLYIEPGSVPDDTVTVTKPLIHVDSNYVKLGDDKTTDNTFIRANANAVSVSWSDGAPTYKQNGSEKNYYYWYEWEITPESGWYTGNSYSSSYNNTRFKGNVYFTDTDANQNYGTTRSSDTWNPGNNRSVPVFVKSNVDWTKTFTIRINLKVWLSPTNNKTASGSGYYKLPQTEDKTDVIASNASEAYTATQVVTLNPVYLGLEPNSTIRFYNNDQIPQGIENAIFESKGDTVTNDSFSVLRWGRKPLNYTWISNYGLGYFPATYKYYKIYTPTFRGIKVDRYNYNSVLRFGYDSTNGVQLSGIKKYVDIVGQKNTTAVQKYNKTGYKKINSYEFDCGFRCMSGQGMDQNVYAYVQISPYFWYGDSNVVNGARWICWALDNNGNSVIANSTDGSEVFLNYPLYPEFEK